ncbi:MAG TPA: DNA-formamidopyrimidine glycosylase family protein [Thermoanaerobaculia bacterium]|nr:DNA-formamidopyrimidine glycosylase family protein [Thermoanaerobaculia bacterium]
MPELPEVEIYRRRFEACALRRRIEGLEVTDERILHRTTERALRAGLAGERFLATRRHGKHLFARASGGAWLYLHFGMSGDLHCGSEVPRFSRFIVRFRDGELLAFQDMRLFGRVGLLADPDGFIDEKGLGIDPLDPSFGYELFEESVASRRGSIKALLMNQSILAGLGNLWVDEILFQTGIDPRARAEGLPASSRRKIFDAMRRILRTAIARQEADRPMPPSYLIENRSSEARCSRCGKGRLRRVVVAGRTTYFCPAHQRR